MRLFNVTAMAAVVAASLLMGGCNFNLGNSDEIVAKATALLEVVKTTCGVVPVLDDLKEVVKSEQYAGAVETGKFICEQVGAAGTYSAFSGGEKCIAVVDGVCIREDKGD